MALLIEVSCPFVAPYHLFTDSRPGYVFVIQPDCVLAPTLPVQDVVDVEEPERSINPQELELKLVVVESSNVSVLLTLKQFVESLAQAVARLMAIGTTLYRSPGVPTTARACARTFIELMPRNFEKIALDFLVRVTSIV